MLNQPENNLKFEDKIAKAIEVGNAKLASVLAEINIANSNLKVIKKDIEELVKAKEYEQTQLEELKTEISDLKYIKASIDNSYLEAKSESDKLTQLNLKVEAEIKEKEESLSKHEEDLNAREKALSELEKNFNTESLKQSEDRKEIDRIKETLSEAIKAVK